MSNRKHSPGKGRGGKKKSSRRKLNKGDCRFHESAYCTKFHTRCFDCREYLHQTSYRRKKSDKENWRSIM